MEQQAQGRRANVRKVGHPDNHVLAQTTSTVGMLLDAGTDLPALTTCLWTQTRHGILLMVS